MHSLKPLIQLPLPMQTRSVHVQASEKMSVTVSREGGLEGLEVHGMLQLRVTNQDDGFIKIHVNNNDDKGAQLQVILHRCLTVISLSYPA